ncbi:hypothetical protein EJ06DRAFT_103828 [Trichodelitschia bisporula]|uniref:DUF7820 domain-containing protein n=1 Tax=Trichodelitschia bisporula TaxID=703511 RepID=A0A6G1HR66_9PEZI|nr:hypothetical protein EJ06DRAFT_103828 [Trichodelitschia bisporula]
MDRRPRPQSETRPPTSNSDIFDDRYALEDGASSSSSSATSGSPRRHSSFRSTLTTSNPETPPRITRPRSMTAASSVRKSFSTSGGWSVGDGSTLHAGSASRNSMAKSSREARNSAEFMNDASVSGAGRTSIGDGFHFGFGRPSSLASFATLNRSQSPFPASSGPSHPYHMYPQSGVPRPSSVSTTSTRQMPNAFSSAGPQHPYRLYQQNSFPEDDGEGAAIRGAGVPVGFPGRVVAFRRRIGPDGEEQDILGPDGHTEQLPPYSQYPEEGEKGPLPIITPLSIPVSPPATIHSHDNLLSAQQISPQREVQSLEVEAPAAQVTSSGSSLSEKKPWKEKTWKEKQMTRVCGGRLPVWVIVAIIAVIVFIGIILGGVVGGMLSQERSDKPATVTVTSTNTMFDASQIPAPSGMPPVPTGDFWLPLGPAQEEQQACLVVPNQMKAWGCDVAAPALNLEISTPPGGYSIAKIWPQPFLNDIPPYGAQPPRVQPKQKLIWVTDLDEPTRGPALHFQTVYDKLVILDHNYFVGGPSRKEKRAHREYDNSYSPPPPPPHERDYPVYPPPPPPLPTVPKDAQGYHRRVQLLREGEQPWYCFWNQTFIEGFIYLGQNATAPAPVSSPPSSPSASATMAQPTQGMSPSTPTPSSVQKSTSTTAAPTYTPHLKERFATTTKKPPPPVPTEHFPYIVKVEERRIPNPAVQPYCQKMSVQMDGNITPMLDDDGNYIRVYLNESDPSPSDFAKAYPKKPSRRWAERGVGDWDWRRVQRRDDPAKSCHCVWVTPMRSE